MKQKLVFIFTFVFISFTICAQNDTTESTSHRFYGGAQIGGQNMFSLFHEIEFYKTSALVLHTHILAGINNMGKNEAGVKERAIYGFQAGVIGLIGKKALVGEIGIIPTLYSYNVAFANLNGWIGLRLNFDTAERLFISLAYTPCLYKTYTDPDHKFFKAPIGFKFGVNF